MQSTKLTTLRNTAKKVVEEALRLTAAEGPHPDWFAASLTRRIYALARPRCPNRRDHQAPAAHGARAVDLIVPHAPGRALRRQETRNAFHLHKITTTKNARTAHLIDRPRIFLPRPPTPDKTVDPQLCLGTATLYRDGK